MFYHSTRGSNDKVTAAEAIRSGLANDGGLFVPDNYPVLTLPEINDLCMKGYEHTAYTSLNLFLDGFAGEKIDEYTRAAYCGRKFDHPDIAPLHKIDDMTFFLELWHGPTGAFKDMALQIMPYLLIESLAITGRQDEVCILVATSGDTGKAALEGFRDVSRTRIMVFYPKDGVSDIQKLQMTAQQGKNVNVAAVRGNFDDTQTGVKKIFTDKQFAKKISSKGYFLSSANSINWGRLVPQIAYYISSYCGLIKNKAIKPGDKINFCVPTGNFGNILAGYYAYMLGLPVGKLICASNRNDVLTQFINTGVYDKNRTFYTTISPSMDILISSNLERLLFELSDKDGDIVASYMSALGSTGKYNVPPQMLGKIRDIFACGYCSEEDTLKTISDTWLKSHYLIDTHTAVAYKVLQDYVKTTEDNTVSVVVSTASAFKFCDSVLSALGQETQINSGESYKLIDVLSRYTGIKPPRSLSSVAAMKERFSNVINADDMKNAVKEFLKG